MSEYKGHTFRSSRTKVFYKKCALKNFAKFTGKHLGQGLFFSKVARLATSVLLIMQFHLIEGKSVSISPEYFYISTCSDLINGISLICFFD